MWSDADEVARSTGARRLGRTLRIASPVAAAICLVVAVAALVRQRPVDGLALLLVPAIPLVAVGQVFAVVLARSRLEPRGRGRGRRRMSWREMRGSFFGGLDRRVVTIGIGVFVVCWLVAASAAPWMTQGGPAGSTAGCPYVLANHGVDTCVGRGAYLHAGAAVQRFVAGILGGFFTLHAMAVWSDGAPSSLTPR